MGLGIEIHFIFDVEEPINEIKVLNSYYDFDMRDGLNLIMTGIDYLEVLEENDRLLKRLEKELNLNLSILDFWLNQEEFNIDSLLKTLTELKSKIEDNPKFNENIDYGFDIEESYLKSKFLNDINFLIKRLKINIENGATKIKYESQ